MTSLYDVYIMAEDRVLTIVSNVPASNRCGALKEAGALLSTRKNASEFLREIGSQLFQFQRIFKSVPASCGMGYVKIEAKLDRKDLSS